MPNPKQPDTGAGWGSYLVVSLDCFLGHCSHSICCHQWQMDVLHSAATSGCNRVWNLPWNVVCWSMFLPCHFTEILYYLPAMIRLIYYIHGLQGALT